MLSKWLTARPKNMQPAASRKHVVPYHESSEESEGDCFACCIEDESTKVIIKSEYNSNDAPSAEEEKPETAWEALKAELQIGDGQEECFACCIEDESTKVIIKSEYNSNDAPSTEEEKPETAWEALKAELQIGDGQGDCFACCIEDESTKVIIKSEYNSNDAPSTEEEKPETAWKALKTELQIGDGQEECFACCIEDESTKVIIKSEYNSNDAPSTEEEKPKTAWEALKAELQIWDGQESPKPKKKEAIEKSIKGEDDDSDQKNPPSIPWDRNFFLHDLRCTNDGVPRKKNCRTRKPGMEGQWKHDKFKEDEQAPKSREELIATYGFDIRACKNPEICPCQPRRRPEKVQNKRRRTSKRLQCSAPQEKTFKELRDLHNRLSPSKSTYSDPRGYKVEFPQNESPSSVSEEYNVFQAQCMVQPSEGSSNPRIRNKAKLAVKEQVVDQRHPNPPRPEVKKAVALKGKTHIARF